MLKMVEQEKLNNVEWYNAPFEYFIDFVTFRDTSADTHCTLRIDK